MILNVPKGQIVLETNVPAVLSAELTRPADTTSYSAGDAIGAATVAVKEKHTVTLAGVFGTAEVSGVGALTFPKVLTFDTDLSTTAANFVTDNVAEYLAAGVVLTSSTNTLIFEAATAGVPIGTPMITNKTSNIAGTVAHSVANVTGVKQKETVTLSGEGGRVDFYMTDAPDVPFQYYWNTDLTTTASDIVDNAAGPILADFGVVLTSSGADLIFEAAVAGVPFGVPVFADNSGDLAGTVDHTTANVVAVAQVALLTLSGTSGLAHVGGADDTIYELVFNTDLLTTAQDFVTNYEADYLALGIVLTAGAVNTLIFTAAVAGEPFFAPFCVNVLGDLAATPTASQVNVPAVAQVETLTLTGELGWADVTGTGGLTSQVECVSTLEDAAIGFVFLYAEDYLAEGIVVTNEGADIIFTAETPGTSFTAPTITNVIGLSGSIAHTTANRAPVKQVEIITATGDWGQATIAAAGGLTKVLDATTSIAAGWKAFKAANLALYDAQGIVILEDGNTLTMTAKVAGTGFTAPTIAVRASLSGTDAVTVANVTLSPITFSGAALDLGKGGIISDVKIESDITSLATKVIRVWLFNAIPTSIVGDNAAYITQYANKGKLIGYFNVTVDALLSGSDAVVGQAQPNLEYVCNADSSTIYALLQSIDAVTTPKSAGKISIDLRVLKL